MTFLEAIRYLHIKPSTLIQAVNAGEVGTETDHPRDLVNSNNWTFTKEELDIWYTNNS